MNQEDRDRADKAAKAAEEAKSARSERDAASKAVLDNMARLKALRLAREAAEPIRAPTTKMARKSSPAAKRKDEKPVALSDWLASQQSGGRRT
jgi:hypothetical protein